MRIVEYIGGKPMKGKHDKHDTDEFPILPFFTSPRTTRELERRQQDFFRSMSGDNRYFDPADAGPDTDPELPVIKNGKLNKQS